MKNNFKKILYTLLFIVFAKAGIAQKVSEDAIPVFTADSLKSGAAKDILTNFFQLAFNNLIGDNKEFNFNSNPYAVLLKNNPKLAIDTNYKKYRALRRLNFGFGIKLDSAYHFNGFSSGIKYSIVDKRDATTSSMLFYKLRTNNFNKERDNLLDSLDSYIDILFPKSSDRNSPDFEKAKKFNDEINDFFQKDVPLSSFSDEFQKAVNVIISKDISKFQQMDSTFKTSPGRSIKNVSDTIFEGLKNSIKKDLLWTIAVSDTTYNDQFFLSNIVINSELSKGIFETKPGANNIELNIKTACNFLQDTLQSGRNLKRLIFSFEPGINWVIRDKNNDKSFFELKFSGSYYHNFSGLYADEERDKITLNGTARVRIYEDIWIPLEIKYDPKNGNVFGFLNIKANFTGLGKLLKGAKE
jgi:hypothetical protein